MGAAVAAAVVRRERLIVEAYRRAGAVAPERARTPEELFVHERLAFRRLVGHAVLRDAGGGRYFLDEPSWMALRGMRRRLALAMALVALAIAVGVLIAGAVVSR
jgi:hypothetical protein